MYIIAGSHYKLNFKYVLFPTVSYTEAQSGFELKK